MNLWKICVSGLLSYGSGFLGLSQSFFCFFGFERTAAPSILLESVNELSNEDNSGLCLQLRLRTEDFDDTGEELLEESPRSSPLIKCSNAQPR